MSIRSVCTAGCAQIHPWRALGAVATVLLLVVLVALTPAVAAAVPAADHVHLDLTALRLNVNDYSIKHQVRLVVTITADDESRFDGVDEARMTITNPRGAKNTQRHYKYVFSEKKFKAANATVLFKAVDDSAAPLPSPLSNVPAGFFSDDGPYVVMLTLRGKSITGTFSFGEPLAMTVSQSGQAVNNFSLKAEAPLEVATTPAQFGPVYYKRQDLTNFVYQLANMDQALSGGDFHAPIESPRYVFQVRAGDANGGTTRLIDPSRYIAGYEAHLIRSELTATPLHFPAAEFRSGEAVIIDFQREEISEPDTMFVAAMDNLSSAMTVEDRVVFALYVQSAPTDQELGRIPLDIGADSVD